MAYSKKGDPFYGIKTPSKTAQRVRSCCTALWDFGLPLLSLTLLAYYAFLNSETILSLLPVTTSSTTSAPIYHFSTQEELTDKLEAAFPYTDDIRSSPVPQNVIQIWLNDSEKVPEPLKQASESWRRLAPDHFYTRLGDDEVDDIIRLNFARKVPEVYQTYNRLSQPADRAELARYLLLYVYGGVYADMGVTLQKPIEEWFPSNGTEYGFYVAVESDSDNDKFYDYLPGNFQFARSTLRAKPHHPLLAQVIAKAVRMSQYTSGVSGKHGNGGRILGSSARDLAGPAVFTETVFKYLSSLQSPVVEDFNSEPLALSQIIESAVSGERGDGSYGDLSGMAEPIAFDDVLLLPEVSFKAAARLPHQEYAYVMHGHTGLW